MGLVDSARKGLGLSSSAQSGVLFLTYSTLTSSMKAKNSRLNQILSWCGKDFDGCLLFDECHKAKNCSEATTKKGGTVSQVSKAVGILQSKLPQARVVYCSATGVSGVGELGYMCRLGLWGPHTSFKDFDELFHCISNRGLGALEMLAMQLKLQGKFISRGLSYEGAEFSMATIELTPVQRQAYAAATCVWKKLQVSIAEALVRTQTPAGIIWRNFWSSHQRFFRQLIMGIKVSISSLLTRATNTYIFRFCLSRWNRLLLLHSKYARHCQMAIASSLDCRRPEKQVLNDCWMSNKELRSIMTN